MTAPALILLALAIPAACVVPVLAARNRPNLREAFSLLAGLATFTCVALLHGHVAAGERPEVILWEMLPGLPLAFRVEPLGMLFALIASGLWPVTTLYAIGYMRGHDEGNQTRFYAFFALAIASALGIAFSGNLLTLFVFYEALTIGTFPLVTHSGTHAAKRAGRVYLGILVGTSVCFLLLAIVWTRSVAGTLDFAPGGILAGKIADWAVAPLFALYVFGIGKAALMPFHRWLPAAMVAPTPVSALLHAVAVVKAGVFSLLKVTVSVFGLDLLNGAGGGVPWLAGVAGFTIIAASLVALTKDNLKARLAYSTVSQLSYIVLGAAILAPLSIVGAAVHIAAHAFGKITLFFAAGAVMVASHKTEISQMGGIGRRMPWTMGAFAVGALSMIGLPPTAGFVSKWYVLNGAVQAGHLAAAGVVVASTLLNAAYFLPIIHSAFFGEEKHEGTDHHHGHGEAPWPAVAAVVATAAATVAFFLAPGWAIGLGSDLVGRMP